MLSFILRYYFQVFQEISDSPKKFGEFVIFGNLDAEIRGELTNSSKTYNKNLFIKEKKEKTVVRRGGGGLSTWRAHQSLSVETHLFGKP